MNDKLIIYLLLLAFIITIEARPTFVPFHGVEELLIPQTTTVRPATEDRIPTRFVKQSFRLQDENNRHIHLAYEAEHLDHIVSLDAEHDVHNGICKLDTPDQLLLEMVSEEAARSHAQRWSGSAVYYLTGGIEWGCLHLETGAPHVLLRKVLSAVAHDATISVITSQASYTDLLKNASITFSVSKFPEGHFVENTLPTANTEDDAITTNGLVERGPIEDAGEFLSWIWAGISTLPSKVESMVSAFSKFGQFLKTGEFNANNAIPLASVNWNYASGSSRGSVSIDNYSRCLSCYAKYDLTIDFKMAVTNYNLKSMLLTLTGKSEIKIEGDVAAARASSTQGFNINVAYISMPPIVFAVGPVPVVIEFNMPINVGYDASITSAGRMSVSSKSSGTIRYGVEYSSSAGWNRIVEQTLVSSGTPNSPGAGVSMNAMIYLLPVLDIKVQLIGGLSVGSKLFLESGVDSASSVCSNAKLGSTMLYMNWGVQSVLGAFFQIGIGSANLVSWKSPFVTLASLKNTLSSGCFNAGKVSLPPSAVQGEVYTGVQKYGSSSCKSKYPNADDTQVSIQYTMLRQKPYLFVSYNKEGANVDTCVGQALYLLHFEGQKFSGILERSIMPVYQACGSGKQSSLPFDAIAGTFESDWKSLSWKNFDKCLTVSAKV